MTKKLTRVSTSTMKVLKTNHQVTLHRSDLVAMMRHYGESQLAGDIVLTDSDGDEVEFPLRVTWTHECEADS